MLICDDGWWVSSYVLYMNVPDVWTRRYLLNEIFHCSQRAVVLTQPVNTHRISTREQHSSSLVRKVKIAPKKHTLTKHFQSSQGHTLHTQVGIDKRSRIFWKDISLSVCTHMTRSNVEQLVKKTSAMCLITASFRLLLLKLSWCRNRNISKSLIYSKYSPFLNLNTFAEVTAKKQAYLISLICGHLCIAEARVAAPTPVRLVAQNLAIKKNNEWVAKFW